MSYNRRNLLSYDENSFERELINKLNEESSIHNDSGIYANSRDTRKKKKRSHYRSGDYKSKTSMHHKSNRSKFQKKNYSDSDSSGSCSTCRLRDKSDSTYSERTYTVKSYHNKSMRGKGKQVLRGKTARASPLKSPPGGRR